MSTKKQRQEIGYMRKILGIDEDTYREMLNSFKGAKSSKDLTDTDAKIFLNSLRDKGKQIGVFKPVKQYIFQKYKYNDLGERDGMASPAQLRKIEAMWYKVSHQTDDISRQKALNYFAKRLTGKENLKFLESKDAHILIKALDAMQKQKNK